MTWRVVVGTTLFVLYVITYVGFIAVERGDGELERRHATPWTCSRRMASAAVARLPYMEYSRHSNAQNLARLAKKRTAVKKIEEEDVRGKTLQCISSTVPKYNTSQFTVSTRSRTSRCFSSPSVYSPGGKPRHEADGLDRHGHDLAGRCVYTEKGRDEGDIRGSWHSHWMYRTGRGIFQERRDM